MTIEAAHNRQGDAICGDMCISGRCFVEGSSDKKGEHRASEVGIWKIRAGAALRRSVNVY